MKYAILFFTLSLCTSGYAKSIDWPFTAFKEQPLVFDITIGTPPQSLHVVINPQSSYDDLEVADISDDGVYDSTKSKTFVKTGDAFDDKNRPIGFWATDDFSINGVKLQTQPFKVVNNSAPDNSKYAAIGLGRSRSKWPSFIESVMATTDKKQLVLSYDYIDFQNLTGILTIGSSPESRCSNDWVFVPESPDQIGGVAQQWAMKIDSVEFGKYGYDSPGLGLFFANDPILILPNEYYMTLRKILGADSGYVPCDIDIDIVFYINGLEFRIKPQDYTSGSGDNCFLMVFPNAYTTDNFILPSSLLRDRCMLWNYEDITIGFASRLT
ncbi:putative vacuolar aspartyl protease [Aphelenchoides besseyi]|nr:putative vacuolar aspartyl protease [Aphelenchoides besseyi]